ncbi:MAG: hypothetical protein LBM76_00960 [Mycoplasmataceae bacterium]|jgi:hypothetical protein|nr:hypothetical protein [Mycoplasmataceae bacterium]
MKHLKRRTKEMKKVLEAYEEAENPTEQLNDVEQKHKYEVKDKIRSTLIISAALSITLFICLLFYFLLR